MIYILIGKSFSSRKDEIKFPYFYIIKIFSSSCCNKQILFCFIIVKPLCCDSQLLFQIYSGTEQGTLEGIQKGQGGGPLGGRRGAL